LCVRFGHGDAAPCTEKPRSTRNRLAAYVEEFVNVRAQTERGAHTVVGARSQVPYERVASVAKMHIVSMIIGIMVLPARFTRLAPADTRTSAGPQTCDIVAASTTSVVSSITRSPTTINRAPSKGCDGLRERRDCASDKENKVNDCRGCDHIHSVHGNLFH
jgi:hypothetical protein